MILTAILWGVVVLLAILSQYFIIEKKKRKPNKPFWFAIRVLIAGIFGYAFHTQGVDPVWYVSFMIGTFWGPFNEGLNLLRNKPPGYLGDDWVDRRLQKIMPGALIVVTAELLLFLWGLGTLLAYNTTISFSSLM